MDHNQMIGFEESHHDSFAILDKRKRKTTDHCLFLRFSTPSTAL